MGSRARSERTNGETILKMRLLCRYVTAMAVVTVLVGTEGLHSSRLEGSADVAFAAPHERIPLTWSVVVKSPGIESIGVLHCPDLTTCIGSDRVSLLRLVRAGASWTRAGEPAALLGEGDVSDLSCPATDSCFATSPGDGAPAVLATTDGVSLRRVTMTSPRPIATSSMPSTVRVSSKAPVSTRRRRTASLRAAASSLVATVTAERLR